MSRFDCTSNEILRIVKFRLLNIPVSYLKLSRDFKVTKFQNKVFT